MVSTSTGVDGVEGKSINQTVLPKWWMIDRSFDGIQFLQLHHNNMNNIFLDIYRHFRNA